MRKTIQTCWDKINFWFIWVQYFHKEGVYKRSSLNFGHFIIGYFPQSISLNHGLIPMCTLCCCYNLAACFGGNYYLQKRENTTIYCVVFGFTQMTTKWKMVRMYLPISVYFLNIINLLCFQLWNSDPLIAMYNSLAQTLWKGDGYLWVHWKVSPPNLLFYFYFQA